MLFISSLPAEIFAEILNEHSTGDLWAEIPSWVWSWWEHPAWQMDPTALSQNPASSSVLSCRGSCGLQGKLVQVLLEWFF